MAGNVNTAPTKFWRMATKFSALFVGPRANKEANASTRDMVRFKVQGGATQTCHLADFLDSTEAVLAFIDGKGNFSCGGAVGNGVVRGVQQTNLTAAQINGMFAAPVAITPVPAAGQAVIVDQILVVLNLSATAFLNGGVVHFYYHGATVELMAQTIPAATVLGGAAQIILLLQPVQTAGGSVVTKEVGVDITNATGAFDTGTGTAKIFVAYHIVTL